MTNTELERYVRLYHKSVYRLVLSYVKNEAEAQDIAQDAFCRFFECDEHFAADENVRAWLFRVAINLSKNLLKSKRYSHVELDETIPAAHDFTNEETELWETVQKLPPKYREVIHLHYYEGYSAKEIAAMTGSTVSTVTTRLARARDKLRKMLLKEGICDEKGKFCII